MILVAESAEMMGKCQPDVWLVAVVMPCGRAGCVKPNRVSGKERLGTRLASRLYDPGDRGENSVFYTVLCLLFFYGGGGGGRGRLCRV